jgi:hypothetical protein
MIRHTLGSQVPLVRHPECSVAVRRQYATRARLFILANGKIRGRGHCTQN